MTSTIRTLTISLLALASLSLADVAVNPDTQEIYRTTVRGSTQLVVDRCKLEPLDLLKGIMKEDPTDPATNAYTINAALVGPNNVRIPLGSTLEIDKSPENSGCHVLAFAQKPNEMVLALAMGRNVALWRISLRQYGATGITWPDGWQASELTRAQDQSTVSVAITQLPDGRWAVAITDREVSPPPTATFEQAGDDWRFVVTHSWRDDQRGEKTR
ncbi:MAG: hypothetical protein ABSH22_07525 [Tepidisphaeraceae bacterium]|jgi:hypothetical protein